MKKKNLLIAAILICGVGVASGQVVTQQQEKIDTVSEKATIIREELTKIDDTKDEIEAPLEKSEKKAQEDAPVKQDEVETPKVIEENEQRDDITYFSEDEPTLSEPKEEGSVEETPEVPEESKPEDSKPEVPETGHEVPEVIPPAPVVPDVEEPEVKPEVDTAPSEQQFLAAVEQRIYELVNVKRQEAGLFTLSYNTTMQKYARLKSQDMGNNGYFDHKDLNGQLITAKMDADGVTYQAWGENIAYIGGASVDGIADQFMTNWMNSDGHRANILSNNFDSIGVGVYQIGDKVYATQEFHR